MIAPERGDRRFGDRRLERGSGLRLSEAGLSARLAPGDRAGRRGARGSTRRPAPAAQFFTQAYLNALSPANFAFTNPEAIRRAIDTGSISLLSGLANLLADAATDAKLPAAPGSAGVRARQGHRRHARQRDLPERADAAHPVRAGDGDGGEAPASLRAAAGEQILSARPPAQILADPLAGRAGPQLVRHLLGQSRPGARRQGHRRLSRPGPARRARRDREGDRRAGGRPVRLLHGRHARRHGRRPAPAGASHRLADHDRLDVRFRRTWANGRPSRSRSSSKRWRSISRPRA